MHPVLEPIATSYHGTKKTLSVFPEFLYTYTSSRKSLVTKQRELELEVERLENKVREESSEIEELQGKIFFNEKTGNEGKVPLVMYPLMKDMTSMYSTIILSKGFKDGIDIGTMVFVRGGQAVCSIKEVYTSSSLCLLLTASGVVTEGVTSSSSLTLSLVGRGGYYVADIVRGTLVKPGEVVYLRSNPKIVLGTIKEIINNDQDTSWHLFIKGDYSPTTSSVFYARP
jgi:cell shape-determining protein MreC